MLIADLQQERQAPSPNAKLIQERVPLARSRAEQDGIDLVNEVLLWNPATLGGTPCVERASKCALSSFFAPPPTSIVADGKPDHCYGYLPPKKARPAKLDAPFSRQDENIMNTFSLTDGMYFPFFTAQWKSPAKSQTHHQAIPQGARDGATINNHLHLFYSIAPPDRPPSLLETCHFSATIDMRFVILWVHWRDVDEDGNACYRMEEIESGMLNKERDNKEIRTILRNLQEHAMGARLQDIKTLLPEFWARYEHSAMRKGALKARNTSDAVSVVSSSSVVSSTPFVMQMLTPPPVPGEPVRKRKRETSESQPSLSSFQGKV